MAWSLPLYTYKDEDFKIPISLDYRFDGCRPAQPAGTVGMGWSLNCGGVITRQVVGLPDDYIRYINTIGMDDEPIETAECGFYFAAMKTTPVNCTNLPELLETDAMMDINHCISQVSPTIVNIGGSLLPMLMGTSPLMSANTIYSYQETFTGGPYFDPCSDIYHFSLPEVSGDFVIQPDGRVKVYNCSSPEGEVSVNIFFSSNPSTSYYNSCITLRFRGSIYVFGGDLNHLEYQYEAATQGYNNPYDIQRLCFTALYLKSVTAANGRIVEFFRNAPAPCNSVRWNPTVKYGNITGLPDRTDPTVSNTLSWVLQSIAVDGDTLVRFHYGDKTWAEFGRNAFCRFSPAQYTHVLPTYQAVIQPDSEEGYNVNNRLSSVVIHNRAGEQIDSISLNQHYSSHTSSYCPKMFLDDVTGNAGTFSFHYDYATENDIWPPVDTVVTDHWGYWNGQGGSYAGTSTHRQRNSLYDLDPSFLKEADSTYASRGALRRIDYPSGGYSLIDYEINKATGRIDIDIDEDIAYSVNSCTQFPAGGMRVARIINDAGSAGSFRDTIRYDYCDSGLLMRMPRYYTDISCFYIMAEGVSGEAGTTNALLNTSFGNATLSTFNILGLSQCGADGHINYPLVRVHRSDGSWTEHRFSDWMMWGDQYLNDFTVVSESSGPVVDKIISGHSAGGPEPDYRQTCSIEEPTNADPLPNLLLANICTGNFSCMRGKPVLERVFSADSTLLQETHRSYNADTVASARGVFNMFCNFVAGDRIFIQSRLDTVITTEYLPGGGSLSDTTLYTYNNLGQQTVVEKRGFDGSIRRSRLHYEHESDTTAPRANISEAASTRVIPEGDGTQEYITSLRHFEYDTDSARRHLPVLAVDYGHPYPWVVPADTTVGWFSPLVPDDSTIRRLSYDAKHRPDSLLLPGGAYVAFVWDTSGRYPLSREDNGPSMVSTYQWKDMVGLTKKTEPALRSEWYAYDSKWRLSEVRRADSVKITAYDYHLWCEDSTAGPSYTKQTTWRTSNKNNSDIVYYDGLGYPIQKVRTSTQANGGHIVTPIRYDALRRDDAISYLPYEALHSTYNSADSAAQSQYYKLQFGNSEIYPYAEKVYGTSPAGRLLSSRQPGKDYADSSKVVTYDYRTNSAEDSILDLSVTVIATPHLTVGAAFLPAGRLMLTKTTDEDGCTSEVFTDASGKTVLSRQRTGGQRLDTYRIYDLRDSLVCVLQPEGAASIVLGSSHALLPPPARNSADTIPAVDDLLEKYAFLYAWDSRGRLAAKKRPGADAEEFLSDDRGRVVLSRDGNLRSQGKWLYSEYDEYDALLKKSLIEAELGLDTLRHAVRGEIDSTVTITRDTTWMWPYFNENGPDIVLYGRTAALAAGDSLFTDENTYAGPAESSGNNPSQGHYVVFEMENYYVGSEISCFPHEYRDVTIDADWPAILVNAITNSTLLEEHRYDRGDSPEVTQALDFIPVTGIVAAADTGSTHNLEVWQRQLMLPPGRTVPGDTTRYVERAFYYDAPGNLVQTVEKNALGGTSRTSAKYDYLGNVTASEEKHSRAGTSAVDVKRTSYAYDKHGRVSSEYVALNNTAITSTEFDYDIFGRLTWTWGQGEDFEKAVQETYNYDIRGRLLAKEAFRMAPYVPGPGGGGGGDEEEEEEEEEDPEWDAVSLFNTMLRYSNPLKSASIRKWNGLISEIEHQRGDNGTIITNDYFYDHAGRLVDHMRYDGNGQTNKYTERDLSFDRNGNILTLKRYGATTAAPQDNLAYTYSGNKLSQLNNWAYGYDDNGNMTSDGRRNMMFTWNHLNLPATISNDEDEDATVNYTYLADGTKVLTQAPGTGEGYAYLGTMVYSLDSGSWTLETTPFTGGRFVKDATGSFVEQRHVTDHLGSTRVIVTGTDYHEVEHDDYYPFGKRIVDNTLPTIQNNRWRFSGKEIQTLGGIGLVDFGARLYDDFSGRWQTQDALSHRYIEFSPYSFCGNNPINVIDPDGREIEASFDKQSNKLYIVDLDQYNEGLPEKYVSASEYKLQGIRDNNGNLTHNQILVVENVFSGGEIEDGVIVRDLNDRNQIPLANASYDILDNHADTRHTGWFRLDRQDQKPYNDKDDITDRDGFRFHLGGLSYGCVTVDKTQPKAQQIWEVVTSILNNTSTKTVPERRGSQRLNPFSRLTKYGTMQVTGQDRTPSK